LFDLAARHERQTLLAVTILYDEWHSKGEGFNLPGGVPSLITTVNLCDERTITLALVLDTQTLSAPLVPDLIEAASGREELPDCFGVARSAFLVFKRCAVRRAGALHGKTLLTVYIPHFEQGRVLRQGSTRGIRDEQHYGKRNDPIHRSLLLQKRLPETGDSRDKRRNRPGSISVIDAENGRRSALE
jgi:hypothetical protein